MSDTLLACRDCGQLHRAASTLVPGHRLACIRCGRGLSRYPPTGLDAPLALATTALILLLLANVYPIFLVNLEGRGGQDLLISGPLRLSEYGGPFAGLGMLVAGLSFVIPLVWLCLVVIVLTGIRSGDPALRPRLAPLWKTATMLYPWSVLGVRRVWDMIADPQQFTPQPGEPWVMCGACQLVTAAPEPGATAGRRLCPRCATALEPRQPGSLSATLALISAAAILYLPANL